MNFYKKKTFCEIKKKITCIFSNTKCPKFVRAILIKNKFKRRGKFSFEALKEKIESQKDQIGASKMFV